MLESTIARHVVRFVCLLLVVLCFADFAASHAMASLGAAGVWWLAYRLESRV